MPTPDFNKIFSYDPDTGHIHWLIKTNNRMKSIAGCKHQKGFIQIRYQNKSHKAHRLAWLLHHGYWPNQIDHINRDQQDNRLINLRNVTATLNLRNRRFNSTYLTGVTWLPNKNAWLAKIGNKHLYHGKNFFEACCRRKAAEVRLGYNPTPEN